MKLSQSEGIQKRGQKKKNFVLKEEVTLLKLFGIENKSMPHCKTKRYKDYLLILLNSIVLNMKIVYSIGISIEKGGETNEKV